MRQDKDEIDNNSKEKKEIQLSCAACNSISIAIVQIDTTNDDSRAVAYFVCNECGSQCQKELKQDMSLSC